MLPNNIAGLLGLARRAGKVSLGHDAAQEAIFQHHARLCILASDAADRLKAEMKKTIEKAEAKTLLLESPYSKIELATCLGTKAVAVLTVDDEGFAKAIEKQTGRDGYYDEKI